MTRLSIVSVNSALHTSAEDLVRQFDAVPAGSVLRCFARAVGEARRAGCDLADLPREAQSRARTVLAQRTPDEPGSRGTSGTGESP